MKKLMLGNEAIARGAYEAGVRVVASYPGTPSTEITENIVKYDEIYVEWASNEKVAAEVAIGASIAGARSMSCMKHVGMNVMADPMFTVSYIGTNGGIYTLTDTNANVESYWVTPLDKFKYPHKLKTTNKRGCVAEATGDVSVYAKLEDTGFELVGTYKNVTDYFVSRIKRKKFKDIQLKFHSNTRFSLETVTLECFIGGYIKR